MASRYPSKTLAYRHARHVAVGIVDFWVQRNPHEPRLLVISDCQSRGAKPWRFGIRVRATGALAHYATLDVRDAAAVTTTLAEVRTAHGPIRGFIHGAGVLADKLIEQKTEEQFDLVYGTKVHGLRNLLAATAQDELRLIALFSSYTGRFGRTGQVDYAAANEVLNKMAQAEARRRSQCRVVAFNWGPWNGGMVNDGLRKIFEREGVGLIEPDEGTIEIDGRDILSLPHDERVQARSRIGMLFQAGTVSLSIGVIVSLVPVMSSVGTSTFWSALTGTVRV